MAFKVHIVFLSIICLLLSINTSTFSQYGDIRFEHLTTNDGLSNGIILCIYQDSMGFIWVGTENGLHRYDGYNFKIFQSSVKNSSSLSHNIVQAILEDDSKNLWIGTLGGGLDRLNMTTERFTNIKNIIADSSSLSDNNVLAIIQDQSRNLWVGTYAGGLNKIIFDNEIGALRTIIHYKPKINDSTSLSGLTVNSISEDKSKNIWIGTNNGLSKYSRENDSFINYKHDFYDRTSISSNEVLSIYEDRAGDLWIGTNGGGLNKVMRDGIDQTSIKFAHFKNIPSDPTSVSDNSIFSICEDNSDFLWLGTLNGVNIFDKTNRMFTSHRNNPDDLKSLSGNLIYSICEDNSGIIWLGTYNGPGINKFDRIKEQFNPYHHYLKKPLNMKIKNVFQMIEDRSGTLWFGTYNGMYKIDRKNDLCVNYLHDPNDHQSISNNKVGTICEDRSGKLWIGTHGGGLNVFDKSTEAFIHYKYDPNDPHSLSSDIVQYVFEDKSGTIWICTYGGGFNKFDQENRKFIRYTNDPVNPVSLIDNRPRYMYEDRQGNFWIGNWSKGLSKFDSERELFTHYNNIPQDSTSISGSLVYSIYEDISGNLWIASDGGLNKFDREKETFNHYRVEDGLPDETIFGMLEDDNSNLWLSTNKGLCRFNPVNETFRNYDANDGLQGNEFNPRAYFKTKTGELIFGGVNGFNLFHPDSIKDNYFVPPVVFSDFQLFNESVPVGFYEKMGRTVLSNSIAETSELKLTYEEKIFSFEFAALDFHAPQKNKYAYIMEGFEESWNYTSADRRLVTYTNLDPGEYTFRVKASNNHGIWNEEGASLKIIILPPWWATTWAYIIYALIIISIIYFTWKLQLRRVKIKHEYEMSKFEAEKMHEVDEMKSKFFANISHEFRTPLTLIFGPAKDVLEETNDPEIKKSVGLIKRNATRLYRLVNQLLDLSKLEAGKMKLEVSKQNIILIIKGYVMTFTSLAERKKITLNFHTTEDSLNVYVDKDKLEKIVNNLLSNAIKFTPDGGKIDFTIEKLDKYVQIKVADSGLGIAAERLDKIFDRFYQVDGSHTRESEGTGIGLSLTKELVELHKGKIEVESEYGKGTTFRIFLPLGKEHLKPEEIVKEEIPEEKETIVDKTELISEIKEKTDVDVLLNTDKPLLLIVEDNFDVRKYIISHLEREYRILESANGEYGLQEAFMHIPDLIISDVMMPKMDGFKLCAKLKTDERTSHIPVLLLTAKAAKQDKLNGLEIGADDYIMKPFETDELKARIKNLLEQRRKLREHFKKEGLVELDDKEITSLDRKFLENVIQIINKNISDVSFNVERLADEISMSRRNLDRKLIALVGESPSDLIKRIRLTRASKLLTIKFGNISEIALEVGFSNPANFSNSFREQFGITPSDYQQSYLK